MSRGLRVICAALLALAVAVPVSADPEAPTLRTEQVYFHCNGETKVANANFALDNDVPSWSTDEPTGSVSDGEGCGWADPNALRNTQDQGLADGSWAGQFTGNLSSMTVRLHTIDVGPGRRAGDKRVNVSLFVNGASVFGQDPATGNAARREVIATPVESETGVSREIEFTIDALPFVTHPGDGTVSRFITLVVAAASEPLEGWVYDTVEVPSGIEFNPLEPADVVVAP